MRRLLNATALLLAFACALSAAEGTLILKNGKSIQGDIERCDNGACWVAFKSGSIKFEKSEIQRVVLKSARKRDRSREQLVAAIRVTPGNGTSIASKPTPYDNVIHRAAKTHNVDPALVKAVIKAESNFNPNDTSHKGACGLMQLMPDTARQLGVKQIYSPEENIMAGTRFLGDMLSLFNGNIEMALAAYNAGPGAVKRYQKVPPYRETVNYIRNVNRYYHDYRAATSGRITSYTDKSGCLHIYNND